jgi:hypothetical protein
VKASLALITAGILVGCGHDAPPARAPDPPALVASASGAAGPGNAAPEMAPTPYSTEQLRASNRPGTLYRYKLETAGEAAQIKIMEFTSGTSAESAELTNQVLDEGGKAKSPSTVERSSWEEIRRHAEFPRAGLTVEAGSVEVPAGKFDVAIYTLSAPNGETSKFYFAKSYAGPPVLLFKERAGTRLMTMTLLERKSGR